MVSIFRHHLSFSTVSWSKNLNNVGKFTEHFCFKIAKSLSVEKLRKTKHKEMMKILGKVHIIGESADGEMNDYTHSKFLSIIDFNQNTFNFTVV